VFFFDKIDETIYIIEEIKLVQKKHEIIFTNSDDENIEFVIVENMVNNIGVIYLNKENNFQNVDKHFLVKYEFKEEHDKSAWLEKRWINYVWKRLKIENEIIISEDELKLWVILSSENKDIDIQIYGIDKLDYTEIDEMENINISEKELEEFIEEGHLIK
jgi:hypothetical protein